MCFCFFSCSNTEENIDSFLECDQIKDNYILYNGDTITCEFHFAHTTYNNQEYIELFAHCADLIRPIVINVNCIDICEKKPYDENSECGEYLKSRVVQDIILIEK